MRVRKFLRPVRVPVFPPMVIRIIPYPPPFFNLRTEAAKKPAAERGKPFTIRAAAFIMMLTRRIARDPQNRKQGSGGAGEKSENTVDSKEIYR